MNPFQQYLDLGWKLCRIEPGTKGPKTPGWNKPENALTSLDGVVGAGLMHAYSGTCAIDIDDWEKSYAYLLERGIDLLHYFTDPFAVTISSGTPNRSKLLFRLETPLSTVKVADGKLEFRCATREGASVQDVLPPSVHPSGRTYTMTGEPALMGNLPEPLLRLWQSQLRVPDREQNPQQQGESGAQMPAREQNLTDQEINIKLQRMKKVIDRKDPDMDHDNWLAIGMALHHESRGSEEGFKIWNDWSSLSKDKYPGYETLQDRYYSFGRAANPRTGDYLLHEEIAEDSEFRPVTAAEVFSFDAPKKVNPFKGKFLTPDQWGDLPEPEWIIDGILPRRGIGSMVGPSGSGKSFMAINLGLTVNAGGLWRGRRVKQGSVAYICAEDAFGNRMRVKAGLAARNASTAKFHLLDASPRLHDKENMLFMAEAIQELGDVSLIFVDTLAAATPGMDENSAKEVTEFLDYCRQLMELTGCMVMLIHHTGKDASRGGRGSSAYLAGYDAEWIIKFDEETQARSMVLQKIRNAPQFDKDGQRFEYFFALREKKDTCTLEWL